MTPIDRPLIVVVALAYLAITLVIGAWAARRTRTARDFFIAGQRVGLWITGLATMSAAFSGVVFLGGPGLTYRLGLVSLWIVLPVGFTSGLLCWVVGVRLRALTRTREIFTVPDALAARFASRSTTALAAVAVALGSIGYLAAQLLALGVLLQATLGLSRLAPALLVGLLVLVLYSAGGGMIAGVYTDLLQGTIMLVAAIGVFWYALRATGGWRATTSAIMEAEAFGRSFLEPLAPATTFTAFGFFFVFGVGVLGQPHMLHKFYMLDRPEKLRWFPLLLGFSQALCLLIWFGLGLAVPALVARGRIPPLETPDAATPTFLFHHAPELLAGITIAAVLAAIMSTSDSFLNIGSAALVRDLPRALGRPLRDELIAGRLAVVVIGGLAGALALGYADLIALLGTFAFGTFAAALAPTVAVGLCWERVTGLAATSSMATGLALNLGLESWQRATAQPILPPGVLPSAVALAASLSVLLLISAATPRGRQPCLDDDVRRVMRG